MEVLVLSLLKDEQDFRAMQITLENAGLVLHHTAQFPQCIGFPEKCYAYAHRYRGNFGRGVKLVRNTSTGGKHNGTVYYYVQSD